MNRLELLEWLYPGLPQVTALVGGGGKTSLLGVLGDYCAQKGEQVLLTTTTHLGWTEDAVSPDSLQDLNRQLEPGKAVLAGYADSDRHKLTGIPVEWYADLKADRVIVEADGSRCLPLKYHRSFEPVIPPETGLVIELMGLSALGQPVKRVLHGWQETGLPPETIIEEHLAAQLLERGLKRCGDAEKLVLLNQADTPALKRQGEKICALLEQQGVSAKTIRLKERAMC